MKPDIRSGIDVESVERIAKALNRSGDRLLNRLFTEEEVRYRSDTEFLTGRFAAKEAFFKALGTGVSDGVRWHDLEVPAQDGQPLRVVVRGRSKELLGSRRVFVSVSSTPEKAAAFVLIAGSEGQV
ncbi:MAG: holo-[acyl-carrier-protein] synthase [Candidatus Aegiribacteria sp.]|nr:holo-[acyl-carrier-protein] synthase [Candidatus Aegiribacteria sp.]MBD3294048.1 holo-[acyl-carrier-protein] synthase [Candidatus Fermentibacteria bacterium]